MPRRAQVELKGKEDVKAAFANLRADVRDEVKIVTKDSLDEIWREAKSRVRQDTGVSESKVTKKITDGGLSGEVGGTWYKLRWLEFGYNLTRWVREGRRGVATGEKVKKGRITAKNVIKHIPARPWLFPAFEMKRPQYLSRLKAALYGVIRGNS